MNLLEIRIEGWSRLVLSVHLLLVAVNVLVMVGLWAFKMTKAKSRLKEYSISEATLGLGNSTITFKYDNHVKEIAYKIWVELITRKIGIPFDEASDVIDEVYASWYEAFKIIRNLLEEMPANRINDANGLIELATRVLNDGLRPHLTMWQAKFRSWYEKEKNKDSQISPQELQRRFPEYQALVSSLKEANETMTSFAEQLKKFVDDDGKKEKKEKSSRSRQK